METAERGEFVLTWGLDIRKGNNGKKRDFILIFGPIA